jgi:protein phosphatase
MAVLHASGVSDCGPVRSINEDCFGLDDERGFGVVADGMGGHNAGEVAAGIAVRSVTEYLRESARPTWPFGFDASLSEAANRLRTAIYVANQRILATAAANPAYAGMGTTIVAALAAPGGVAIAHVGDSRLYLFRAGRLDLRTQDDSWNLNRHVLTNVLGTRPDVEVHVADEPLADGDLAVLTTDGVHGTIDELQLERLVAGGGLPAEIARRLVSAALSAGSRDNCTAVVLRPS